MKATPHTLGFPLATTDLKRGKGIHASDIYGDFFKKLEPKKYGKGEIDDFQRDLLFAIGQAWEQYLEKVLIANGVLCIRPGEMESDEGIKYSPDLLLVDAPPPKDRIGEIKATYQSSRTCLPGTKQFEKYLAQAMLYCFWTEIPRCRFYVLYIHGDWRRKLIDFKAWDIDFTSRDLKDNHRMLMNHARDEDMFATHRNLARAAKAIRNGR